MRRAGLRSGVGEDVSEADVLRLALDGHLALSVYLVNSAVARLGKVIPISEAMTVPGIPVPGEQPRQVVLGLQLNDSECLVVESDIVTIKGVWDLSPIGGAFLDVENKYHESTGGPVVTRQSVDGVWVKNKDGQLWQLQESYDDSEFESGSAADQRRFEEGHGRPRRRAL